MSFVALVGAFVAVDDRMNRNETLGVRDLDTEIFFIHIIKQAQESSSSSASSSSVKLMLIFCCMLTN
jgi:hypothetical protein